MAYIESAVASNFPTAYVRVALQTYVLQHIRNIIDLKVSAVCFVFNRKKKLPVSGVDYYLLN